VNGNPCVHAAGAVETNSFTMGEAMRFIAVSTALAVMMISATSLAWEVSTVQTSAGEHLDMEIETATGYAYIAYSGAGSGEDRPIHLAWDNAPFNSWSKVQIHNGRKPKLAIRNLGGTSKKAIVFAQGDNLIYAENTTSTPSGTFACLAANWRCRTVDPSLGGGSSSWDVAINGDGTVNIVYEKKATVLGEYWSVVRRNGTLAAGFGSSTSCGTATCQVYDDSRDDVHMVADTNAVLGRADYDAYPHVDYNGGFITSPCYAEAEVDSDAALGRWAGTGGLIAVIGNHFAAEGSSWYSFSCTEVESSGYVMAGVDIASRATGLIPRTVITYHTYYNSPSAPWQQAGLKLWSQGFTTTKETIGTEMVGQSSVVLTGSSNLVLAAYHDEDNDRLRVAYEN
jgi:hypothetical protein